MTSRVSSKLPKDRHIHRSIPFAAFFIGKEKEFFIEQLGLLLSSGIGIIPALRAISRDVRSGILKKILIQAEEDIEAGQPLWYALENMHTFPDHIVALIRTGEEAGRLTDNLAIIASQEEKDRAFRSKLHSAMMYPLLVLSLATIIGLGIAWFILPRLALVFADLDITLPVMTRALIAVGTFLGAYGKFVIPGIVLGLGLVISILFFIPKTKHLGQGILLRLPGIGRLLKEVELGRMGYLLGTLLDAGIPIVEAFRSLAASTVLSRYRRLYQMLQDHIEEGQTLGQCFEKRNIAVLIPHPIQQLLVSGEESGKLSEIFRKIGTVYESKTDATAKNLTTLLEPLLLFIVWLGVIAIALAVILPIYSLIGGIS